MSRIVISDTCICLDVYNGGLLELLSALPFAFAITDFVAEELDAPDEKCFIDSGFTLISFSSEEVIEIIRLNAVYNKPSVPDCSCVVAAKREKAILLTGDKGLRKMAEAEAVVFRGLLWLLDELVKNNAAPAMVIADALETIIAAGSRLPQGECERRLKTWRGEIKLSENSVGP